MIKENLTKKKLHFYPTEIFKEIKIEDTDKFKFSYAISNYGRLVSFTGSIEKGTLVNSSKQDGYRIWRYKIRDEKKQN